MVMSYHGYVKTLPNVTKVRESQAKVMTPKTLVTSNLNLIVKKFSAKSSLLNYFL